MVYIITGLVGFVFFLIFDLLSLKNRIVSKYIFALTGLTLVIYSTVKIIELPSDTVVSNSAQIISLALAIIFFGLLIYSVFIEVGVKTYRKIAEHSLVTNGTYSLVRHPGVIWLFLTYFFGSMYFENSYLVVTAIIWTIVNTIYIALQEKLVLKKLFNNYGEYIKATPMIIPNITSFRRFITIQNWRK
jgi:protein-S-isoprenylcysteine O-methyltransferase Ste14